MIVREDLESFPSRFPEAGLARNADREIEYGFLLSFAPKEEYEKRRIRTAAVYRLIYLYSPTPYIMVKSCPLSEGAAALTLHNEKMEEIIGWRRTVREAEEDSHTLTSELRALMEYSELTPTTERPFLLGPTDSLDFIPDTNVISKVALIDRILEEWCCKPRSQDALGGLLSTLFQQHGQVTSEDTRLLSCAVAVTTYLHSLLTGGFAQRAVTFFQRAVTVAQDHLRDEPLPNDWALAATDIVCAGPLEARALLAHLR